MRGAIHPLPQYASMAWCSVKAQGQLDRISGDRDWQGIHNVQTDNNQVSKRFLQCYLIPVRFTFTHTFI
jgi:hypothetical protein